MKYASLHSHSTFSFGDGFGSPDDHMARAAELEIPAYAATEHGNVSSHVQYEKAGKKHGVQPIYGVEAYTAANLDDRTKQHLTILATDERGYRSLNRLVTKSWEEGFYFKPTILREWLFEDNGGLIVLSGCSSSQLAVDLLGGRDDGHGADIPAAERTANDFKSVFGDRYYLECQAFPELDRTRELNGAYQAIGRKLHIPIVATSDVHYPRPADNEIQKILHTATRGLGTVENAEAAWEYDIRLTLPTSDDQILRALVETGLTYSQACEAVNATGEIAQRCSGLILPKAARLRFDTADSRSIQDYLWDQLRIGYVFRTKANRDWMRANRKAIAAKLKYEMDILTKKDFLDYFAIIANAVQWAKDHGILVGPARGSAAASVVCWLLRITEVNPMLFPTMMFERFIDENREDMPDIDLDFDDARRWEVRAHLVDEYGAERVGNVCNYTRYRGKNSVDDVARATSLPFVDTANFKKYLIERPDGDDRFSDTIEDTARMFPAAGKIFARHKELDYARRLEGNYKGLGVHAAGIVISTEPISDIVALYRRDGVGAGKRTVSVLAVDKWDAEYLNMIKMDFLGLQTMGSIAIALDDIGMTIDELYAIPLDDPKTMEGFTRGDTIGIFQWDGATTALINGEVKPTRFMELADINALSRPGALFSGAADAYIRAKRDGDSNSKIHPLMDKYTASTHGQIVYQEQVLALIRDVGGFAPKDVNKIRKIIGKKQGAGAFNSMHAEFNLGALKQHGINEATADRIWEFCIASAGYSFNVAHSVSYSMLAFWQMWLKQNHAQAFYHGQLVKTKDDKEGQVAGARLIRDAERHGVLVEGCDLRASGYSWSICGDRIIAGFSQIHGIGAVMGHAIVAERDLAPFESWADLGRRTKGVGPKRVEAMEQFAESSDPFGIRGLREKLQRHRRELRRNRQGIPRPTHSTKTLPRKFTEDVVWVGYVDGVDTKDFLEQEQQSTGESAEAILAKIKRPDLLKMATITAYDDGDDKLKVKINRYKYQRFMETLERIEKGDLIVVQGTKFDGIFKTLHAERIVVMQDE